ncbi:major facilitator superfamily domain-containing protein [Aspergillus lucknowensis]|uniref:Major facilitator superfamily domain-containing protein n=1 Tax=Aspergillus lucknowensis TaxID=176173 RepID=A0ABR4LD91_9EURO
MANDLEKASAENVETVEPAAAPKAAVDIDVDEEYSYEEQRKIIHRVDRRLIIICGAAYCISLMDRTNVSIAAISGMLEDLELQIGFRYSIMVLVFFVTYVTFQPLATAVIRYIGPRIFLSAIVMTWGACLIGFAYSPNWQTLAGLRALLGILEAGFFPGTVYLLSTWYSRYEVHKRYSFFYLIGCVASALSGILAYGFSQMKPLQGLNGWQWIFIMQAVLTFIIGILCMVFVVDFPDKGHKTWGFLNEKECQFILRRLDKDRADANPEPFSLIKFLRPALDLKVWGLGLIFFCLTTVTYAIAYFLPIILRDNMGFSVGASQCLIAPPYVLAGILMLSTSWVGDKYRMRAPILVFNSIITLIGLPVMGFAKGPAVRYFGVFLTTAGANANIPASMAYQANNIRGQWTRAFASATLVGLGGVGGIAGSLIFRSQDAPDYIPGIWGAIASQLLLLIIVAMLSVHFWISNRKADRGEKVIEGSPDFRYTI